MYETAKQLVDAAIKAHMQMFEVDWTRRGIGFAARQKSWAEKVRPGVTASSVLTAKKENKK